LLDRYDERCRKGRRGREKKEAAAAPVNEREQDKETRK